MAASAISSPIQINQVIGGIFVMSLSSSFGSNSLQLTQPAYVSLGTPRGLTGANSLTLEIWINPASLTGTQTVLSLSGTVSKGTKSFKLYLDGATPCVLFSEKKEGVLPPPPVVLKGPEIVAGDWCYLAATYDGTGGTVVLFVNGLQASESGGPRSSGTTSWTYAAQIGSLTGGVGRVSLWSCARSSDDVLADGSNSAVVNPVAETALDVYVDFTNLPPVDQSGYQTPVQYMNGAMLQFAATGVSLNGVSQYVRLGTETEIANLEFSGTASFTVDGWLFPTSPGAIVSRADPGAVEYLLELVATTTGNGAITFTRGATTITSLSIPLSRWHHFTAVYDGSDNALYLYVDGNLQATLIATGDATAPAVTSYTLIGASTGSGAMASWLGGFVQSVRIWNVALGQDEIRQWLYNQPVTDTTLAGAFNFTVKPPVDTTSLSYVYLGGNAQITQQTTPMDPASLTSTIGGVCPINASYFNENTETPAPPPSSVSVGSQAEPWSEEHKESSWQSILGILPASLTDEQTARLRKRFEDGFALAKRKVAENPKMATGVTRTIEKGVLRMTYHGVRGDVVFYEGTAAALDACTQWWMTFVMQLTVGFLQAVGIAPPYVPQSVTNRVYNKIVANKTVVTAITTALAAGTITAAVAIKLMGTINQQKLLWTIMMLLLPSCVGWAFAYVFIQCVGVITGVEAATLLANFIVWASQLTYTATQYSGACPKKTATA